jgi:DNA-binding CsgD family transcriptional regulator
MARSKRNSNGQLGLTQREKEVLKHLSDGYSNEEVAAILHVSNSTVMAHRARIMLKINLHSLAGLVKHAIKLGLTTVNVIRPLGEVLA